MTTKSPHYRLPSMLPCLLALVYYLAVQDRLFFIAYLSERRNRLIRKSRRLQLID